MGDESELRDVLVNMVFNAVDAMPEGGVLTLAAEDFGDSLMLSVADNGIGMTSEISSRVFDPFFTTKGKAGMGLGLAVSFGIVRRHGGTIEVDSQVGCGSTFKISLPAAADTIEFPSRADSPEMNDSSLQRTATKHRQEQLNILVVDDEIHVRELLKDILESEGCDVQVAGGGIEALELFDAREFHAVFTDVGMPGMSGWELAHSIRQRSDVPIAVITGWGEALGSDDQKKAGVEWIITKPFQAERIAALAGEIASRRQTSPDRPFSTIRP
jgi:CheY-like chemotaxis protein